MKSKVIVEGPDCSGKSTLVNQLKNKLRWDSKSLHHREGKQFERYLKEYSFSEGVVLDRSHFSEAVYSEMWRGGTPFEEWEEKLLDELAAKTSVIVLACPSLGVLRERYKSRGYDQQISLEELEMARKFFLEKLKDVNFILYESKDLAELDDLIRKVEGVLNESLRSSE
ncbi:MAG: hypothetical protein ABH864_02970 [archaeon]